MPKQVKTYIGWSDSEWSPPAQSSKLFYGEQETKKQETQEGRTDLAPPSRHGGGSYKKSNRRRSSKKQNKKSAKRKNKRSKK